MNFQIQHVLSDLTGVSGMTLIDAILKKEKDPEKLLSLTSPLLKADQTTLLKSLQGSYDPALLFQLQQSLDLYRYLQRQILEMDEKIQSFVVLLAQALPQSKNHRRPSFKLQNKTSKRDLGHSTSTRRSNPSL